MSQSLHEQVFEYVRSRIRSGEFSVGDQIPTENELASILKVSRPTVRHALESLVRQGFLIRLKGRGTFVTQPKVEHKSTSFITGYRAESAKNNRAVYTRVLDLKVVKPEEHVAKALELAEGEKVTRLIRLRNLENDPKNAPVVYSVLYVPFRLFPEMSKVNFVNASFYEILTEKGLEVMHSYKKLEVVPPSKEIAAELTISPFEPVIFVTAKGLTKSMVPVEYTESYYPAGTSSFLIENHR